MRFKIAATFSVGGVGILLMLSAPVRGADLYVPQQFTTLQQAIDAAAPGDTIVLAAGAYDGGVFWSGVPLTVKGQGAGATYIDANGSGSCLTVDGLPADSRIEGITFRNGFGDYGGAIACHTDHLSISDCEFVDNQAFFNGGAISIEGSGPQIERCRFRNNVTLLGCGGAICSLNGTAAVSNCDFTRNTAGAAGGAVASLGGSDTMAGCRLESNSAAEGGGTAFLNSSSSAIRCVFNANTSSSVGGGATSDAGPSVFLNCAFWKNTASTHGGGVSFAGGNGLVINCSFASNTSTQSGCAVAALGGNPRVVNSILWFDGASETFAQYPATLAISSSNLMGSLNLANNNINADPQYLDASTGDLRVKPTSPGIDKGANDPALAASASDLGGNMRVIGPAVDVGAYETKAQVDTSALILALKAAVTELVQNGANLPARGQSLQAKLDTSLADLQSGDHSGAAAAVQDFINQVRAFVKTGRLTPTQGQPLLDSAAAILNSMGA